LIFILDTKGLFYWRPDIVQLLAAYPEIVTPLETCIPRPQGKPENNLIELGKLLVFQVLNKQGKGDLFVLLLVALEDATSSSISNLSFTHLNAVSIEVRFQFIHLISPT